MPWYGWIALGVSLVALEAFLTTDFVIALIGAAGLTVGLLTATGLSVPLPLQWVLFGILSVCYAVGIRRWLPRSRPARDPGALLSGEVAVASETIAPGETGAAELRGVRWKARNRGRSAIGAGERARVERVDGLLLHVRSETESRARRRFARRHDQPREEEEKTWKP